MLEGIWQGLKKQWGYDANEKAFLNAPLKTSNGGDSARSTILLQTPQDYYILALYRQVVLDLSKQNTFRFAGLWPTIFSLKQESDLLYPLRAVYARINTFMLERKWLRLYHSAGVEPVFFLDTTALPRKLSNSAKAFRIWRKIKANQELVDLSIDGLYCGDLIYDTYLRYRVKPTLNVNDLSLLYYIYKCICVIESVGKLVAENNISHYFGSYSTYIQHGIPVRIFIKHGIAVYTSGNLQQRFKKLTIDDWYHTARHRDYHERFAKLEDKENKIKISLDSLHIRFQGGVDRATAYMKKSAFHQEVDTASGPALNFDGVVYLHDFYDSPHIYSHMFFPDFYQWATHTLDLISKHKLNVGIKPHPNQSPESRRDLRKLKSKYPSVQWIDPAISNISIINSGIKFVVSVYGTVLHEFAYHGINPICAGDNPHTSFSFVHYPETVEGYDDMVIHFDKLRLPGNYKDQVAEFYYMHNIHDKEDYAVDEELFKNYNILNGSTELLARVIGPTPRQS